MRCIRTRFHIAWAEEPIPISTGEHTHNRVIFKLVQIDAARVAASTRTLPSCCWRPSLGYDVSARRRGGSGRPGVEGGLVTVQGPRDSTLVLRKTAVIPGAQRERVSNTPARLGRRTVRFDDFCALPGGILQHT